MSRRLLIMACSATKSAAAQPLPAIERYTGPVWQTLKAADPQQDRAHVTVLSARHGWIDGHQFILNYDQTMDADRSRDLLEQGLTPEVRAMLAEASAYGRAPFSEVCIVGGHLYQAVAQELVREAADCMVNSPFTADLRVVEICDQVGLMRQRLRAWLATQQQVAA